MKRLVVLASGNGSNLQAILDAVGLNARVEAVISNRPWAYALERAMLAGVPAHVMKRDPDQNRRIYDAELAELVASYDPDWVVLAGWMHLLSSAFLDRFPDRVINLHPALPGAFPGTNAIERALTAKAEKTGVMVHLVPDEGVDSGPVLAVEEVPIRADDTLESLSERIHLVEHRLLVETLRELTA